jgi:hypothetical protein
MNILKPFHFIIGNILVFAVLLMPSVSAQNIREDGDRKNRDRHALFESLSAKIDQYQDLLVICDSLKQSENTNVYQDRCLPSLKALQSEIFDLKKRLDED